MAKPPKKQIPLFNEFIDGVYGRFKTTDSYEVNYILGCLSIDEIGRFSIASSASAFEFSKINFEDLMQRDVDYERVDEKIIKQYLEKGLEKVLFFPPIIVSVIALENGHIKDSFDTVEKRIFDEEIEIVFDEDKFCISLPIVERETAFSMEIEGQEYNYNPAWATFKYQSRKIELIVIDGQHRFEALKRLSVKNKSLIQSVELPVCIVFMPTAKASDGNNESIVRDLRAMFVTINTTAKEVSGHFIDLLQDDSLSSMAVRSLANYWKQSDPDPCRSKLQQLEWNERNNSRANTVQRIYSITTVSILAESLRMYAFDSAKNGLQYQLLDLKSVASELRTDEASIDSTLIAENEFHISQEPILRKQIEDLITPALDVLFMNPRPYKSRRASFLSAVIHIDGHVQENRNDAATFKEEVLAKFRRCTEQDSAYVKNYEENEFLSLILSDEDDDVYFLNVFQQALIGAWANLSAQLMKEFSIPPDKIANALVEALDAFAFHPRNKLFEKNQPYTNLLLYSGNRILISKPSKDAWADLLSASLLQKDSKGKLESWFSTEFKDDCDKIITLITTQAKLSLSNYLDTLYTKIFSTIKKDWPNRQYPRGLKDNLEKLHHEDIEAYNREIDNLAIQEHSEAVIKLRNRLDLKPSEV